MAERDAAMAAEEDVGSSNHKQMLFPYHAKSKEECLAQLGVIDSGKENSTAAATAAAAAADFQRNGLSSADAAARLLQYGPNALTERKKVTIWERIWHQVGNVMVGILVFVAIVSAIQAFRYSLKGDTEEVITDCIQVGLIVLVIL